jgi:adenylate cyclase
LSLFNELKRRNVFRVGAAYVVGAWLLIQVAETIFPLFGFDDAPARIVVIVLAIAFVPSLIFAWAFELTPEGLKKESEVDRTQSIAPNNDKKLDRMIMVVLALALGYFAFDKFVLTPQREVEQLAALEQQKITEVQQAHQAGRTAGLVESYGDNSIAVLPFVNMSSDVEQEYFSDGISEELLNLLTKVNGLRVISRTSAFSYKGSDKTTPQIADELNVAHVLEGSVRKAGDRIRLTVQLIEASSDTHLWSETYDRELKDIFAIQDEVAALVVEQLKIELDVGLIPVARHDPHAYALYLEAAQILEAKADMDRAEKLLLKVLDIDPEYLDAKVELSWVYARRANDAFDSSDHELADQLYARREEILNEVAAINPDNVQLNVARGWDNMRNVEIATPYIERALATDPHNSRALNVAVVLLTRLWRQHEAVPIGEYVFRRDPLNIPAQWNLARAALNDGQYELAEKTYRTYDEVSPGNARIQWLIGLTFLLRGNAQAALEQFRKQVAHDGLRLQGTALALHDLGRKDDSDAALTALIAIEGWGDYEGLQPFFIATAYAWIDDADRAFEYLEKQREIDSGIFRVEAHSPLYQKIEKDPRWIPFRESVEVGPKRLGVVEFKPRLPNDMPQ